MSKSRTLNLLAAFAVVFFASLPCKVSASHAAGGELMYEWISDSTYRIYFKFYKDCSGVSENISQGVCYYNSCDTIVYGITLQKMTSLPGGIPNGTEIGHGGCPGYPNKCSSASSTIPGFKEWWYSGVVTLPKRCDHWTFYTWISARNLCANVLGPNQFSLPGLFYTEATLDNLNAQGNSSVFFSVKPVPYVCLNQPHTYNNGAVDPDNDSLSFEMIMPAEYIYPVCYRPANPVSLLFATKTPTLNLSNNPFQTNNTYTLNPVTGGITYTSGELGGQTTAILVREFRNKKQISSVIRDVQTQVLPCTTLAVSTTLINSTITNATLVNNRMEICAGIPLSFCFDIKATGASGAIVATDNHAAVASGSSVTYSKQGVDSIRGCFQWYPSLADTGLKIFTISLKDSTCIFPGYSISQTFTIPFYIYPVPPPPGVTSPVNYCIGDTSAKLSATGVNLRWHIGSFSGSGSPVIPMINANVPGTTNYFVTQSANNCVSNPSLIKVTINEKVTADYKLPRDTVCQFEEIGLTNLVTNPSGSFYAWHVDTGDIKIGGGDTNYVRVSWSVPGLKKLKLHITNGACESWDSTPVFVQPIPAADFEIRENICIGENISIIPTKQNASYQWTIEGSVIKDTVYKSFYKLLWTTVGTKKIKLQLIDRFGCSSEKERTVRIYDRFDAGIETISKTILCAGDTIHLHATEGNSITYEWTPIPVYTTNNAADVTAVVESNSYLHLKMTNQWGCVALDSEYVTVDRCCELLFPNAFTPNGDGRNDYFRLLNPANHVIHTFLIADRWGRVVFDSRDATRGWDGSYKGKPKDSDTYYYYIKYLCNGKQTMENKGDFILIR
jgi:gliding motility-associated-like protein